MIDPRDPDDDDYLDDFPYPDDENDDFDVGGPGYISDDDEIES